jgi:hypothetical protein
MGESPGPKKTVGKNNGGSPPWKKTVLLDCGQFPPSKRTVFLAVGISRFSKKTVRKSNHGQDGGAHAILYAVPITGDAGVAPTPDGGAYAIHRVIAITGDAGVAPCTLVSVSENSMYIEASSLWECGKRGVCGAFSKQLWETRSVFQGPCGRPVERWPSLRGQLSKRSGRSSIGIGRCGISTGPGVYCGSE